MVWKKEPWLMGSASLLRYTYPVSSERPIFGQHLLHNQARGFLNDIHLPLEFGIVLTGRLYSRFLGFESRLEPGQVWLHGMWEPHGCRIVTTPCELLVIFIWPPLLMNLCFEEAPSFRWLAPFIVAPANRPQVHRDQRADFIALGRSFTDLLNNDNETNRLRMRLLLMQMLVTLMTDWQIPKVIKPPPQHYYNRLNSAIDLVFDSHHLVTMDKAARACAMGYKLFGKLFRQLMGITFPLFALRYRLSGAKEQLTATDDPLKAISNDWGFTDESHFRRTFIKCYGCTPNEYRKKA